MNVSIHNSDWSFGTDPAGIFEAVAALFAPAPDGKTRAVDTILVR